MNLVIKMYNILFNIKLKLRLGQCKPTIKNFKEKHQMMKNYLDIHSLENVYFYGEVVNVFCSGYSNKFKG